MTKELLSQIVDMELRDQLEAKEQMIKNLKVQLESETLAKNEGAEIVAELKAKNKKLKYDIETYHSQYKALVKQNSKLLEDSQVLTRKLLQTNPDLKEWLEKHYGEYL